MMSNDRLPNPQLAGLLRDGRLPEALSCPILAQDRRNRLRGFVSPGKDAAFAGLTFGDLVYDALRVDPMVMDAIDFSRTLDLSDVFGFAAFARGVGELPNDAYEGSVSQMQGYVAERIAAQHLSDAGHDVTFPSTSNQQGWDLLVDGQPFQVKCVSGVGPIHGHSAVNPDIPLIVNAERAADVADLPGVYVDPLLSVDAVRELTETALRHGAEVADFETPWIALAVASAAEVRGLVRGEGRLEDSLINITTDVGGRIAGGTAGHWAGGLLGAYLFGPAGAIVIGGLGVVAGGIGGSRMIRRTRLVLSKAEADCVVKAAQELGEAALQAYPAKSEAWAQKQAQLADAFDRNSVPRPISQGMLDRLADESRYLDARTKTLKELLWRRGRVGPSEYCQAVLLQIRRMAIHPSRIDRELSRLADAVKVWRESVSRHRAG